jgi:hypothetical protein
MMLNANQLYAGKNGTLSTGIELTIGEVSLEE